MQDTATLDELRELLHHQDPDVRLHAAWEMGVRIAGVRCESDPTASQRRLFMMPLTLAKEVDALGVLAEQDPDSPTRATAAQYVTRLAVPGDPSTEEVLLRLASSKKAGIVNAVAANLRSDIRNELAAELDRVFRNAPESSQQAVLAWKLSRCEDVGHFLRWLSKASPKRIQQGLSLLRTTAVEIAPEEIPRSLLSRHLPVLVELSRLTSHAPERAPVQLWIQCATHCEELWQSYEDVLDTTAQGLAGAVKRGAVIDQDTEQVLFTAIRTVVKNLPRLAHESGYLCLNGLGLIAHSHESRTNIKALVKRARRTDFQDMGSFAAIWLALVRLVNAPTIDMFELRPAYR